MFGLQLNKMTLTVAAAALALGVAMTPTVSHAVTCPLDTTDIDRFLKLETDPASSCLDSGTESTADKTFLGNNSGFEFIAKEEEGDNGLSGILTGLVYDSTNKDYGYSGTITLDTSTLLASYNSFALLFKVGKPATPDSWFALTVPNGGFTDGTWAIVDINGTTLSSGGALSHVTLFAAPIPLPAGGLLLITALGGLGIAARRRRKSS